MNDINIRKKSEFHSTQKNEDIFCVFFAFCAGFGFCLFALGEVVFFLFCFNVVPHGM